MLVSCRNLEWKRGDVEVFSCEGSHLVRNQRERRRNDKKCTAEGLLGWRMVGMRGGGSRVCWTPSFSNVHVESNWKLNVWIACLTGSTQTHSSKCDGCCCVTEPSESWRGCRGGGVQYGDEWRKRRRRPAWGRTRMTVGRGPGRFSWFRASVVLTSKRGATKNPELWCRIRLRSETTYGGRATYKHAQLSKSEGNGADWKGGGEQTEQTEITNPLSSHIHSNRKARSVLQLVLNCTPTRIMHNMCQVQNYTLFDFFSLSLSLCVCVVWLFLYWLPPLARELFVFRDA